MKKFLSAEPIVKIQKSFTTPFKNAIATARTCYSSKGIIRDTEFDLADYQGLAKSIYDAGHHTVFSHAYFQFELSNISRYFVWSFLHSHPFYNSEQISQRYVEVKEGNVAVPPLEGESLAVYLETVRFQMNTYKELTDLLLPITESEYHKRFPARASRKEKHARDIKRKAQEVARYVLPISVFANMYHTVSCITLLRYHRLCQQYDTSLEQRLVVSKMINELLRVDPLYETILEDPIDLEQTPEFEFFACHQEQLTRQTRKTFVDEFDRSLEGRVSRLIDYKVNGEAVLAQSVRQVLGVSSSLLSDDEAIDLVLNPARNKLLGESLVLTTHSKLARTLYHPSYSFRKRLSHSADSQNQRHRMTPASRPCLHAHFTEEPDYIVPELVRQDERVNRVYEGAVEKVWSNIRRLKSLGVSGEFAVYLLPNATAIRFTESSDLLNLHHKLEMRLCYLAQEEIWRASLDEAQQIREINPRIGRFLLPPCGIRDMARVTPICPERARFCGVKVWDLDINEYERVI